MNARSGATARDPRIAATVGESTPWWEDRPRPADGAPNVLVVVLDDTGWSDFGCFGSEIPTPNLDRLAAHGARFNNFHVTPLCSPTRASLLTGQHHHAVGMRFLAVADTGFPNARGELPRGVDTVPQLLRDRGYGTYLVGKWHLAPQDQLGPAGPFHNWPLARGFDRFYGFLGGASDQFHPELYRDHSAVELDDDPEYHLSRDLVDQAIAYLSDHTAFRSDDPFYLQLAFGATHAPFQAPAGWIARHRGRYADGWDRTREARLERQARLGVVPDGTVLAERDDDVPRWEDLTTEERRVAEAGQEAFAGFLEHTDHELGRLLSSLQGLGVLEDTMIVVFSDNGAAGDGRRLGTGNVIAPYNSLEIGLDEELGTTDRFGGRDTPAHYATGWAMAGNTPFRLYKQFVDLGGTRSPLIVHWPGHAPAGAVRGQFTHVVDLAATILDRAFAVDDPARAEVMAGIAGAPMTAAIGSGEALAPRRTQHFEMLGHRAIRHDGWRAVTRHTKGDDYDDDTWRLYDSTVDFAEAIDRAGDHPALIEEMERLWWQEAEAHGVLPLDDRTLKELLDPGSSRSRPLTRSLALRPGQSHLGFTTRLTGTQRSMVVTAEVELRGDEEGVLLASGAGYGGYVLYLLDHTLWFEHHLLNERVELRATLDDPASISSLGFVLRRGEARSATVALTVNGEARSHALIPTTSMQLAFYGLDVGQDRTGEVARRYAGRGRFPFPNGRIHLVTVDFDAAAGPETELSHHLEANE